MYIQLCFICGDGIKTVIIKNTNFILLWLIQYIDRYTNTKFLALGMMGIMFACVKLLTLFPKKEFHEISRMSSL